MRCHTPCARTSKTWVPAPNRPLGLPRIGAATGKTERSGSRIVPARRSLARMEPKHIEIRPTKQAGPQYFCLTGHSTQAGTLSRLADLSGPGMERFEPDSEGPAFLLPNRSITSVSPLRTIGPRPNARRGRNENSSGIMAVAPANILRVGQVTGLWSVFTRSKIEPWRIRPQLATLSGYGRNLGQDYIRSGSGWFEGRPRPPTKNPGTLRGRGPLSVPWQARPIPGSLNPGRRCSPAGAASNRPKTLKKQQSCLRLNRHWNRDHGLEMLIFLYHRVPVPGEIVTQ